jgi:ribose 5-phosphate isomerase B
MKPTIIIGADHAGFRLKERVRKELEQKNFSVLDLTPRYAEGDDYPPIGMKVARRVAKTNGRGILICGSGVGMLIAANRVKGARAVLGRDANGIKRARRDGDVNVLALSGWNTNFPAATKMIRAFLTTKRSNAARHRRRVRQLG